MDPVLLTSFMDVIWWMLIVFFWTMVLWMFIALFGDIFRRRDHSGWAKAGWLCLIVFLPFLGALIYIILRPTEADVYAGSGMMSVAGASATDEIERAHKLLEAGALTQAEFDEVKRRALGTA